MVYPEGPNASSPPGPTRHRPARPARIVVLVSGSGTNLQALIDAVAADPDYGAEIVAVGADRTVCRGLERAEQAGIPTFALRVKDFAFGEDERSAEHSAVGELEHIAPRTQWDRAIRDEVAKHQPDLIVSAGFMKLLGPDFLAEFGGRVINTHPALSPSFPGMRGPQDALEYGVKVTGCTVFFVAAGVDDGPVIAQAAVPVEDGDDVASLHERIKTAERALLVDVVGRLARHGWTITERKVTIP